MKEVYDVKRYKKKKDAVYVWLAAVEAEKIKPMVQGQSLEVAKATVAYVRAANEMRERMAGASYAHKKGKMKEEEMNRRIDTAAAIFEGAMNLFRPESEKEKSSDAYCWDALRHVQAAYGIESKEYRISQAAAYRLLQYHDELTNWEEGDYSRKLPPKRRFVEDTPDKKNIEENMRILYGEKEK